MARKYTLTLKTLKLKPGQYIITRRSEVIGRCRVCGEIIHATICHPEPCSIYGCIHQGLSSTAKTLTSLGITYTSIGKNNRSIVTDYK